MSKWLLLLAAAVLLATAGASDDTANGGAADATAQEAVKNPSGEPMSPSEQFEGTSEEDDGDDVTTEADEPTSQQGTDCLKLNAVFTFRGTHFFVLDNDELIGMNFSKQLVYFDRASQRLSHSDAITAGVGDPYSDMFFLVSGKKEQGFFNFDEKSVQQITDYANVMQHFEKVDPNFEGIDAALNRGCCHVTYFAGCHWVEVYIGEYEYSITDYGRNHWLGLPCNVDAAWASPDMTIGHVVKGHVLYRWSDKSYYVDSPENLFDQFKALELLNLCA